MLSTSDIRTERALQLAAEAGQRGKRPDVIRRVSTARQYVQQIRAATPCSECGAPMADWHNPDHIKHPDHRVARLVAKGALIPRITAEIAASTPLCRRCHMRIDGRLNRQFPNRRRTPRKLTAEQIDSIRRRRAEGETARALSTEYSVTETHIRRLVREIRP